MRSYPVAYRAGARAYQSPRAFNAGAGASPGSGTQTTLGSAQGILAQAIARTESGAGVLEEALAGRRLMPEKDYPRNVPGISNGAMAAALRRAGRVPNMWGLAYRLAGLLAEQPFTRGRGVNVPAGWVQCYPPCLSPNVLGSFPTGPPLFGCSQSPCGADSSGFPGIEVAAPPDRRIMGWDVQPGQFWKVAAQWILPMSVEPHPGPITLGNGADWPNPLHWQGWPELQPIQKPIGMPEPIPYASVPLLRDDPYRQTGPEMGGGGGGDKISDVHMRPLSGVNEKKFWMSQLLALVISMATEIDESVECFWKALPKNQRSPILGRKFAGDTIYYWQKDWAKRNGKTEAQRTAHNAQFKMGRPVHQKPQTMAKELFDAAMSAPDKEAWALQLLGDAVPCLVQNAIVDYAIGKSMQTARKNLVSARRKAGGTSPYWIGLGRGPAL